MSDINFSEYILRDGDTRASTIFHPAQNLPNEIPITTPFTFPFEGEKVCLCLDKSGWWNPLGGHIEDGETWFEAVRREAIEEAGVEIEGIEIKGYILITQLTVNSKYPPKSILPITVSKVKNYVHNWEKLETKDRGKFTFQQALDKLRLRGDNNQMFDVFNYIINNEI